MRFTTQKNLQKDLKLRNILSMLKHSQYSQSPATHNGQDITVLFPCHILLYKLTEFIIYIHCNVYFSIQLLF